MTDPITTADETATPAPWAEFAAELDRARPARRLVPLLARLRHAPDVLLHGARRRLALRQLRDRGGVSSILFVCAGNIYRSPFAAAVFSAALPGPFRGTVRCSSAGFIGHDRPSPPDAVAAAARRGLDLEAHRSTFLTAETVRAAELIVVMSAQQKHDLCGRFGRARRDVLVLGDLDPQPIETREITDPWDRLPHVLEASYDRLTRCARELAMAATGLR